MFEVVLVVIGIIFVFFGVKLDSSDKRWLLLLGGLVIVSTGLWKILMMSHGILFDACIVVAIGIIIIIWSFRRKAF